ncbi:MAG: ankyrin repeat domain-containing protein, partial [Gammaproteobacteria bacterium]|nr:ankyrin repeat domain-containing protein [Gammaproteobacteria bacterium]
VRGVLESECRAGNVLAVEALLNYNPDLCRRDSNGYTPLHITIYRYNKAAKPELKQKYLQIIEMLLKKDKRIINIKTSDDESPMHLACIYGGVDVVESLLKYRPNLKCKNQTGDTPLHLAIVRYKTQIDKQKYLQIMQRLIANDQSILSCREESGRTPRQLALETYPLTPELGGVFCRHHDDRSHQGGLYGFFRVASTVVSQVIPMPPPISTY